MNSKHLPEHSGAAIAFVEFHDARITKFELGQRKLVMEFVLSVYFATAAESFDVYLHEATLRSDSLTKVLIDADTSEEMRVMDAAVRDGSGMVHDAAALIEGVTPASLVLELVSGGRIELFGTLFAFAVGRRIRFLEKWEGPLTSC